MTHSSQTARHAFAEIVSREDEAINLAEAALLIAAEEYPGLVVPEYLDKLDRFADQTHNNIASGAGPAAVIDAINKTMFQELGFQGNTENYYDPRNSFLNQVIDRRKGIPITLSVVYIEVARSADIELRPVGLPGHFLVKQIRPAGDLFIDPFNGGRVMNESDVAGLLEQVTGGRLTLSREHVAAATNKQILTRILANLYSVYARSMDYARALSAVDRMLLIDPDTPTYLRDRGLLFAAMRKTDQALADLERYLKLTPQADDAEMVRDHIHTVRLNRARLN